MDKRTDIRTSRQTERLRNMLNDTQIDRQVGRQTGRQTNMLQIDSYADRHTYMSSNQQACRALIDRLQAVGLMDMNTCAKLELLDAAVCGKYLYYSDCLEWLSLTPTM